MESDKENFRSLFKKYETDICIAKYSLHDFFFLVNREFNLGFPATHSFLNDFIERFESNRKIHPIILSLKEASFKLGLLTNMYPGMLEGIQEANLLPQLSWDVTIDSSIVKMKKPELEIYKIAEEFSGYQPNEILFIDNLEENLKIPKERGWNTFLYDPSDIHMSNRKLQDYIFS